ncbi:MAG: AGE family epimerase/isomerase [Oscillospiraceae bacterium]|nr:AGE family epimerase/isomerase [Oscillospiraceae bacterium]
MVIKIREDGGMVINMKDEIKNELINRVIPFWDSLADYENGGFYGAFSHDLILDKGAFKNAVLHSRILWFYSNCFLLLKENEYLQKAKHCYDFIVKHFIDRESGGVFWSVNVKGVPVNPMKHGYCNAFFIYAAASYYSASMDSSALNNAMRVFELIETNMADKIGYNEAFDRDWNPCENDLLAERGVLNAQKTTGTVLHLTEAYTELYKVSKNGDVAARLKYLLQLLCCKIYDKAGQRLPELFDCDMNAVGDVHLYGHDIEAAWLMGRAIDVVGEEVLSKELCGLVRTVCHELTEKLSQTAFGESGAMHYESVSGIVNKNRVWWTQAEALTGFLDAYERFGEEKYLERAEGLWEYIKNHVIDKRPGSEWHNELDENNIPLRKPIVSDWKCPYHNGRALIMNLLKERA